MDKYKLFKYVISQFAMISFSQYFLNFVVSDLRSDVRCSFHRFPEIFLSVQGLLEICLITLF